MVRSGGRAFAPVLAELPGGRAPRSGRAPARVRAGAGLRLGCRPPDPALAARVRSRQAPRGCPRGRALASSCALMRRTDPYATLGLEPGASPEDVTLAYPAAGEALASRPRGHGGVGAAHGGDQRGLTTCCETARACARPPWSCPTGTSLPVRGRSSTGPGSRRSCGARSGRSCSSRWSRARTSARHHRERPRRRARAARAHRPRLLWLLDERVMGRVGSVRLGAIAAIEQRRGAGRAGAPPACACARTTAAAWSSAIWIPRRRGGSLLPSAPPPGPPS